MIRRKAGQTSLVRVYKDLAITKRQLMDLHQSISKNISSIASQKSNLQKSKPLKQNLQTKIICYKCGSFHSPAIPHNCISNNHSYPMCQSCNLYFPTQQKLRSHDKQSHSNIYNSSTCKKCYKKYQPDQNNKLHMEYFCGQKRIQCQRCFAEIKRNQIDDHHGLCCYCVCYKCKKSIYYKAIGYHVEECKVGEKKMEGKAIVRKKLQNIENRARRVVSLYPCSLMK